MTKQKDDIDSTDCPYTLLVVAIVSHWLSLSAVPNDGEFMKVSYENDGEKIFAKRRTTYSPGWGPLSIVWLLQGCPVECASIQGEVFE